jgi:hypothetical protein
MPGDDLTKALQRLEELFGKPSQATLGAAVFLSESTLSVSQLDEFAKSRYQYFAGAAWESFGEENWNKTWKQLYRRPKSSPPDILSELNQIEDSATNLAASQLTENHDDPSGAQESLKGVFDSDFIKEVSIYSIGDSEAITGVLIAGILDTGIGVALVFLMD